MGRDVADLAGRGRRDRVPTHHIGRETPGARGHGIGENQRLDAEELERRQHVEGRGLREHEAGARPVDHIGQHGALVVAVERHELATAARGPEPCPDRRGLVGEEARDSVSRRVKEAAHQADLLERLCVGPVPALPNHEIRVSGARDAGEERLWQAGPLAADEVD